MTGVTCLPFARLLTLTVVWMVDAECAMDCTSCGRARVGTSTLLTMLNIQPRSVLLAGDVARACSVSAEAVRKWTRAGRLPSLRTISGVAGSDVLRLQQERVTRSVGVAAAR